MSSHRWRPSCLDGDLRTLILSSVLRFVGCGAWARQNIVGCDGSPLDLHIAVYVSQNEGPKVRYPFIAEMMKAGAVALPAHFFGCVTGVYCECSTWFRSRSYMLKNLVHDAWKRLYRLYCTSKSPCLVRAALIVSFIHRMEWARLYQDAESLPRRLLLPCASYRGPNSEKCGPYLCSVLTAAATSKGDISKTESHPARNYSPRKHVVSNMSAVTLSQELCSLESDRP